HRLDPRRLHRRADDRTCRHARPVVLGRYPASGHGAVAGAHGRTGDRFDADLCADGGRAVCAAVRPVPGAGTLTVSGAALAATQAVPSARSMRGVLRPTLIFLVLALVPLLAKLMAAQYLLDLGSRVMIFAVAAVALDLIVGYGGLVSFGHAGF